jgi:penicillin-binding protein 1A
VSLEEAFAKSVNASAVRLAMQMGVKRVIGMARTLGITTKIPPNLSIALGTGEVTLMELTGASASVANGGLRVYPHGILFIKNKAGRLLYRWEGQKETVLQPTTVENMRRLMGAVMKTGTGRSAAIGRPALGKTGTTQDYRDVWFVGATPELITGIWAGRDSYKPMTRMPGGAPPLHLWKAVMEALLAGKPVVPFPVVSSPLVSSPGVSSSGVSPSSPNGIPGDVAGMTFRGNEQSPSLPSPANTWTDKVPAPLSLDALLEKAGG